MPPDLKLFAQKFCEQMKKSRVTPVTGGDKRKVFAQKDSPLVHARF